MKSENYSCMTQGLLNHDEPTHPQTMVDKTKTHRRCHYKINRRQGDVPALSDSQQYVLDTSISQDGQFIVIRQDPSFTNTKLKCTADEDASGMLQRLSVTTSDGQGKSESRKRGRHDSIDPFCLM